MFKGAGRYGIYAAAVGLVLYLVSFIVGFNGYRVAEYIGLALVILGMGYWAWMWSNRDKEEEEMDHTHFDDDEDDYYED